MLSLGGHKFFIENIFDTAFGGKGRVFGVKLLNRVDKQDFHFTYSLVQILIFLKRSCIFFRKKKFQGKVELLSDDI